MVAAVVLLQSGRNGQVAKSKVLGRVWSPILPIVLVDLNRAHQGTTSNRLVSKSNTLFHFQIATDSRRLS